MSGLLWFGVDIQDIGLMHRYSARYLGLYSEAVAMMYLFS